MNSWKVIFATVIIFGAGVVTGAFVLQFASVPPAIHHPRNGARLAEPGSPGGMRLEFLRRMQKDLALSAEQRDQIDKILKQSQERTRRLMDPIAPQLHQEVQRAKAEFREVLSPAQQQHFDDLLKLQQRFKEQRRSAGRPELITNSTTTNSI